MNKKVMRNKRAEPGRLVGSAFVPNRIFRGRVVEELRDADRGLTLEELGKRVCIDWDDVAHRAWLRGLVKKLIAERIVTARRQRYLLLG